MIVASLTPLAEHYSKIRDLTRILVRIFCFPLKLHDILADILADIHILTPVSRTNHSLNSFPTNQTKRKQLFHHISSIINNFPSVYCPIKFFFKFTTLTLSLALTTKEIARCLLSSVLSCLKNI
jgi:hypothetical protein